MPFTDNMMIPAKAEHIYAAETMMNFVYEPEIAAKLAIYVNYLSPVKGVKEIVEKTDPDIANNPLIFPPDEIRAKLHPYPALSDDRRAHDEGGDGEGDGRMSLNTRRRLLPWLFLGPGLLWLLIFFLYPLLNQASVSLMSGNPEQGYDAHVGVPQLLGRDLRLQGAVRALDRLRRDRDDPVPDHRASRWPTSPRSRPGAGRT